MHKVIAINLNGIAYQLDDTAYDALRAYLDRAEVQLKDNPDRAEIMGDLEQAIADKCNAFLNAQKTVVSAKEIDQIIGEMGPVDSGTESSSRPEDRQRETEEKKQRDAQAPKRLYNIREGALVSGVCNGIAAYFHIDVTIVRIIFVILTVVTKGAWLIAYGVLMFVVPYANTAEERAAAHGQPFNAQELIDQAKKSYAGFGNDEWKRNWRQQRRQWKRQWRQTMREQRWWGPVPHPRMNWPEPSPLGQHPAGYAAQVWAGVAVPVFGIIGGGLFLLLAYSVVTLVNTGAVLGWPIPAGIPVWGGILILLAVYFIVTSPLHAVRRASYYAYGGPHHPWFALWGGTLWLGFCALFVWLVYIHLPEVQQFLHNLPEVWDSMRQALTRPRPS